ncbi:hypothetical protein QTO34_009446 [Cnephaeus nilssonii]|uniref:G-protein coupled receptors family 1 profile domain-containing protein n=1 Tax=Cnephaeus nilssonii TaxID=3371016 RepID=A0AA40HHT9_CNENI|nr:hypothetical protein QTO34_009446 [Eptesicus nilssonii]
MFSSWIYRSNSKQDEETPKEETPTLVPSPELQAQLSLNFQTRNHLQLVSNLPQLLRGLWSQVLGGSLQMGWENLTSVSEFFLLGLPAQPEQQEVLFGLFLSMYLITVAGNLLIILAIIADAQLHTPMYFFLVNLSLADTCFVSTTVPKMLANIWIQNQVISYAGCLSQLYFFMLFGMLEAFLLAVMAYDRYVAICHPLHYIMVMSPGLCVFLVSASWIMTALSSLLHTLLMNSLSFCADHEIPHFFCDINPLLSLSCTDPFINELVIFTIGSLTAPDLANPHLFVWEVHNESPEDQQVLFWMFLFMYLVTVVGNGLIILAIGSDVHLHTPMYLFLANLSFTDLFFVTNTVPKILVNLQSLNKAISYTGCLTQLHFLVFLVTLDNFILATMAYDHYMVICHPLHYVTAMSPRLFPWLQEEITEQMSSRCNHGTVLGVIQLRDIAVEMPGQGRLGPPPRALAAQLLPDSSPGSRAARPPPAASKLPKRRLAAPEACLCGSTAMAQTLSSRRRWQHELSVLPAQSPPQPPRIPPPVSPAGPIMGLTQAAAQDLGPQASQELRRVAHKLQSSTGPPFSSKHGKMQQYIRRPGGRHINCPVDTTSLCSLGYRQGWKVDLSVQRCRWRSAECGRTLSSLASALRISSLVNVRLHSLGTQGGLERKEDWCKGRSQAAPTTLISREE